MFKVIKIIEQCSWILYSKSCTAQKTKFYIKNFFSKCDQICSFLRIWSHLLKNSLMKNFIFCVVKAFLKLNKKILDHFKFLLLTLNI